MAKQVGRKGTGKRDSKKKARSKKAKAASASTEQSHGSSTSAQAIAKSGKLVANKKPAAGHKNKARLVITHSTYLPGLIKLLEKLALFPEIQTITPAVISRVKSNSPRMRLKVSVPITGGHKLIARQRKSAQEVFVITQWSKAELEQAIAQILPKK